MNRNDTLVVLDTCVLLRMRLSDVLMDMRAEHLFSAHWTESIDDEFMRNMVKVYGIERAKVARRLHAMKARCPEWEVFMSSADFDDVPGQVDVKDRHVAAAALALRHAADRDIGDHEGRGCGGRSSPSMRTIECIAAPSTNRLLIGIHGGAHANPAATMRAPGFSAANARARPSGLCSTSCVKKKIAASARRWPSTDP